ncbi:MAG: hypothetical protein AAFR38_08125 [Planctomycetota bacterium]
MDSNVALMIIISVGSLGVTCILTSIPVCMYLGRRAKERTRREIAAYLAEGNITAEDARMMIESMRKSPVEMMADGSINESQYREMMKNHGKGCGKEPSFAWAALAAMLPEEKARRLKDELEQRQRRTEAAAAGVA